MMNDPRADGQLQDAAVGLCAACAHAQIVASPRGPRYYLCRLSFTDAAFPRYPRLPVISCRGFVAGGAPPQ